MLLSVENHFEDNSAEWNTNVPLTTAKTDFSARLTELSTTWHYSWKTQSVPLRRKPLTEKNWKHLLKDLML